jgi:OPA family glycerol-3-phosphate transporter-like MFS transporter
MHLSVGRGMSLCRNIFDSAGALRSRLNRWRVLTIALIVTGYAGYYFCRSDLAVAMPLLIAELGRKGIAPDDARIRLGTVASLGVLAYAIGKFPSGWLADFLGGRRNFLCGMAGAILFTILFGLSGGLPLFTLAWIGNRLVQSLGWAGMVKIASRWFPYSSYGTVMGVVSLSFLFGDAASREFMSVLIRAGLGWRGLFYAAAATLGILLLVNLVLLKETPERIGYPEPPVNPANLFQSEGEKRTPASLISLLSTFARSRVFWLVCLLSCGITLLRETFNLWTPTYFTQSVGLSVADAAQKSALFPLFGGISVLLAGFLSDRLGKAGRATIIFYGMLLSAALLLVLAFVEFGASKAAPVALVSLVAFAMVGPYSYLAGAISLDFGGKQGSATASGLIDGAGYLGGVLAGNSFASVSVMWGWKGAFASLAVVALLSSVAAAVFLNHQRRQA